MRMTHDRSRSRRSSVFSCGLILPEAGLAGSKYLKGVARRHEVKLFPYTALYPSNSGAKNSTESPHDVHTMW